MTAADSRAHAHPLAPGITDVNRLIGLEERDVPFEFSVNRLNDSDFAGAVFTPNGGTMFANIFGNADLDSGMTCAITGRRDKGPL